MVTLFFTQYFTQLEPNSLYPADLLLECALEVLCDLLLEADAAPHLALAQLRQQLRRQSVVRRR